MSFCDHLGADKNVDLVLADTVEEVFQLFTRANDVAVESGYPSTWQESPKFVFKTLCTNAKRFQLVPLTIRARLRHRHMDTAIMAVKCVSALVEGQRNVAVIATKTVTAVSAGYKGREATTVEKKYLLFLMLERLPQPIDHRLGENAGTNFLRAYHINHRCSGHRAIANTVRQGQ